MEERDDLHQSDTLPIRLMDHEHARRKVFLAKMEQAVPRKDLLVPIEPHYPRSGMCRCAGIGSIRWVEADHSSRPSAAGASRGQDRPDRISGWRASDSG